MTRKVGIPFFPGFDLDPDDTGLADTFTLKYKIRKVDTDFTTLAADFVEEEPGAYAVEFTPAVKGDYFVIIESTNSAVPITSGSVLVQDANIDDVKLVVDSISTAVNNLDAAELNNVKEQIEALVAKVDDLTLNINSEDGADAVTSLRELLVAITEAGTDRDGIIAALTAGTLNLKEYITGTEFLADGTTENPFYGKTGADIFDELALVKSSVATLGQEIKDKIDAAKVVIDANFDKLADAGYGLEALKTAVDAISTDTTAADGSYEILNDATKGLVALFDTMVSRFDTLDAAVADVKTEVQKVGAVKAVKMYL
jgi:hypothetical protein